MTKSIPLGCAGTPVGRMRVKIQAKYRFGRQRDDLKSSHTRIVICN
uniref:Uncharacterized protein n=1 Tax=Anguilla anguilla TaxID=7936 RepID=A0A0E9TS79_ANGAN